jgi:hypothetical protein
MEEWHERRPAAQGARGTRSRGCHERRCPDRLWQVRHTRLRPARNAFAYPTYFLMLPLRSLHRAGSGELARNRRAA